MPTYEYHCKKCRKDFEVFQKISDSPLDRCPDCGGKVKRLISATAFALKGSGWYKDGYSSSARKEGAKKTLKNNKPAKKDKSKQK